MSQMFEMFSDESPATAVLQRKLPDDVIEALRQTYAATEELDYADSSGFKALPRLGHALELIYGKEVCQKVGVKNLDGGNVTPADVEEFLKDSSEQDDIPGAEEAPLHMSLRRLFKSGRCSGPEYSRFKRMSLSGQQRDVQTFIDSRQPLPAGTFPDGEQMEQEEAKRIAARLLGRKS